MRTWYVSHHVENAREVVETFLFSHPRLLDSALDLFAMCRQAAADKMRYQKEMESYEPPKGESGGKKAPVKKKKDPNAPKRGMSSFMYFSNEVRAKLKAENPTATFGELVSHGSSQLAGSFTTNRAAIEMNLLSRDRLGFLSHMLRYSLGLYS